MRKDFEKDQVFQETASIISKIFFPKIKVQIKCVFYGFLCWKIGV
jgi:hypothetical protein